MKKVILLTTFGGPEPKAEVAEPPMGFNGKAGRMKYAHPNDDYVQAGDLYRKVMADIDRDHVSGNIVDLPARRAEAHPTAPGCRILQDSTRPDPDYGRRVAEGLKLDAKEVERLAKMSQEERAMATR